MVSLGIGSIVTLAIVQLSMFTARSFAALGNYTDLDRASRNTLDEMSQEIREAKSISKCTETYLEGVALATNNWFAYTWRSGTHDVLRLAGTRSPRTTNSNNALLTGCDYFKFRVWLRNPTNQFWFPYSATAAPTLTKLVDVSWRCSRRVISQFNTESVQTAKIVLRN